MFYNTGSQKSLYVTYMTYYREISHKTVRIKITLILVICSFQKEKNLRLNENHRMYVNLKKKYKNNFNFFQYLEFLQISQ